MTDKKEDYKKLLTEYVQKGYLTETEESDYITRLDALWYSLNSEEQDEIQKLLSIGRI